MKVYCENCRFFNKYSPLRNWRDNLECCKEINMVDDWQKQKAEYKLSPLEKNKNNDCKDYEPRWWRKFFKLS